MMLGNTRITWSLAQCGSGMLSADLPQSSQQQKLTWHKAALCGFDCKPRCSTSLQRLNLSCVSAEARLTRFSSCAQDTHACMLTAKVDMSWQHATLHPYAGLAANYEPQLDWSNLGHKAEQFQIIFRRLAETQVELFETY